MSETNPTAADSVLASTPRIPDQVVHRSFAAETVVLNLNTGKYHGLNPIAGDILQALAEAATVADAVAKIAELYGEPVEVVQPDVVQLCTDLTERGLLELDAPGSSD